MFFDVLFEEITFDRKYSFLTRWKGLPLRQAVADVGSRRTWKKGEIKYGLPRRRSHKNSWQIQLPHPDPRTGRAFGTVLAALGKVEAFLLVPLGVVKHGEVVAGRDRLAVALARVDVVDVVPVAL